MNYVGDYNPGQIVYIYFNTFDSNDPSASVTMTNFIDTDVHIHKDDSLTQRNNAAGVAVDVDVDGITGSHFISIDTSDNTVADFFVAGHDYFVRIEGTTIDGATINAVVGSFSLANRAVAGWLASAAISTLASQTSFTLSQGSADDDAYNNCTIVISDQATTVQKCVGRISDYTGSTRTVTLAADPGIFTMAAGDNVQIFASAALANLDSVGGTAQTANDMSGDVDSILADTDDIGVAGAGLSNIPWNSSWDAEVESEVDDALGVAGADLTAIPWNAAWDAEVESEVDDSIAGLNDLSQVNVVASVNSVFAVVAPTDWSNMSIQGDGMVQSDLREWIGVAPAALVSQRPPVQVAAIVNSIANIVADHTIRRQWGNVTDGDTEDDRSMLGMIAQQVNLVYSTGGNLVVYEDDDATSFAIKALTTSAVDDVVGITPPA